MLKKVFIKTFGCQMNEYDSSKMQDVLNQAHASSKTENPEEADLIILNTCSVREKAEEKIYSHLGEYEPLRKLIQIYLLQLADALQVRKVKIFLSELLLWI